MDALCRLDYQAASQYCTWKLLETTWKCFVSFWMASAIESLSLLSSLSRCNQNWTHTIMHHAFKTWCIVSTNGRYAITVAVIDTIISYCNSFFAPKTPWYARAFYYRGCKSWIRYDFGRFLLRPFHRNQGKWQFLSFQKNDSPFRNYPR